MTAVFSMDLSSEVLEFDELARITGCSRSKDQLQWLLDNHWNFFRNRGGEPVVGRWYARLRMAGIDPGSLEVFQERPRYPEGDGTGSCVVGMSDASYAAGYTGMAGF
jgi:hypothetical protein